MDQQNTSPRPRRPARGAQLLGVYDSATDDSAVPLDPRGAGQPNYANNASPTSFSPSNPVYGGTQGFNASPSSNNPFASRQTLGQDPNDRGSSQTDDPPKFGRTFSDLEDARPIAASKASIFSGISNLMNINSVPQAPSDEADYTDSEKPEPGRSKSRRFSVLGISGAPSLPLPSLPLPSLPLPLSAPLNAVFNRAKKGSGITENVQDIDIRRKFLLKLARALLYFGAPSHRIESQLTAASEILGADAEFVHLPNIIIVTIRNGATAPTRTYFVRATGRLALTSLHRVHMIYRDVLHDKMGAEAGTDALRKILRSPPIYPLRLRCFFAFLCAAIICGLSFGGSFVDIWIAGLCASALQYLGLNAANKSTMYANVYEISVSIIVAFVARGLSNAPGELFCYSAISSAGVVVILPGFTVLISALELMSRNIFCGSVRIVYAIIYTLFLGFGLTIGSDFYLVIDRKARRAYYQSAISQNLTYTHGTFMMINGSTPFNPISGVLGLGDALNYEQSHLVKGCYRDPNWPWYKQPFPFWTLFFLVPIYSLCSSLSNLQNFKSIQLPVMVAFSCCSYAANRAASVVLPGRTDIVSAAGAFVIGLLGNIYSRLIGGTAFTSMVTGVLFLVPSGIAQGGGLTQNFHSSAEQYSTGFSLALRMISVASGVTIGLFVSQVLVYLFGSRKNAAHFAF